MYGYVYMTTNIINNKKYIGITKYDRSDHETYIGSGNIIKRAIKKYGRKAFIKEILEECSSYDELIKCEYKWIKKLNSVKSKEYYNLFEGGHAGKSESMKHYWSKYSSNERKTLRNWNKKIKASFKGFKHTIESKRKIGEKSVNRNWNRPTNYNGSSNPNSKKVQICWFETNKIEYYDCLKDFSNKMKYNYSTMRAIAQRGSNSPKYKIRIKYIE